MDVPEIVDHDLRLEFTVEFHFTFAGSKYPYTKIQHGDITLNYAYGK